jgi:hypothetical protein
MTSAENAVLAPDWPMLLDRLKPQAEAIAALLPADVDPALRAELPQYLLSTVAAGSLYLFGGDARHPQWLPMLNSGFNIAAPNADTLYQYARIEDDGVYRVSGWRGSVRQVVLSVGQEFFGLTDRPGPVLQDIDLDELSLGPDGAFEVLFSRERPPGHEGDWRALTAGARLLATRQIAYDWLHERDAILMIERLDVPVSAPRPAADESARRLELLAQWPLRVTHLWLRLLAELGDKAMVNCLRVNRFAEVGGLATQCYYEGLFELRADEALIIESELPEQHFYWSVLLTDPLFRTVDFVTRQSSLNGFQARVDGDGRVRCVIAASDPGVPNWLDCGGHLKGSIQWRWNRCSAFPQPSVRRVLRDELRRHLPADTPAVSPAEREERLRLRLRGAQQRRRW